MYPPNSSILYSILRDQAKKDEILWLDSINKTDPKELLASFVKAPRHLGKSIIYQSNFNLIPEIPGFHVDQWNLVRLSRVWFLTFLFALPKEEFIKKVETLFDTAELNELVALFSALPLLPYPEVWLAKATDAVRSNMGSVFDAIALNNPFPYHNFTELAWNQLVLKTIFNNKPIELVYGLSKRKNLNLSLSIIDFIKERWAAGREVPSNVWQLVVPFLSESEITLIESLFQSQREEDLIAASLVCHEMNHKGFQTLFTKYPKYEEDIQKGKWNWSNLATVP
ncbi:hypothetical protein EHQ43_10630 [Leptospira bouyouniensis]|uniref:Uncharacterized protein n=1 Tax=Leptospira bouyouniensis TaxID=2484911 RepID=A0A7I0HR28_9LEPT|nr:EboA domain-containing protein [Leptospira bouyouniensis]TGL04742.1 hypothetical protein EHQ43_10630 [Leptospira bouyouniensis]